MREKSTHYVFSLATKIRRKSEFSKIEFSLNLLFLVPYNSLVDHNKEPTTSNSKFKLEWSRGNFQPEADATGRK